MPTIQFVCGEPDGPLPGQTVFKSEKLKNIFINYLIVDNVPENQLSPYPSFRHNYLEGMIDRAPNQWTLTNKLIVDYDECKCK